MGRPEFTGWIDHTSSAPASLRSLPVSAAPQSVTEIVALAGALVEASAPGRVAVGQPTTLGGSRRSLVIRLSIDGHPRFTSVVVKRSLAADGFRRERAGLLLLARLFGERPVAPRILAEDPGRRLLVLEDLGATGTVADLLISAAVPGSVAEDAVVDLFSVYGRVNAVARDAAAELDRLGGADHAIPAMGGDYLSERPLERLAELLRPLGVEVSAAAAREAEMLRSSRWISFSTGDACPDNAVVTPAGVRVCDLELCGFRNALLDGAACHLAFPACWCNLALAPALRSRVDAAYRAELIGAFPQVADDAVYAAQMLRACATWAIVATGWLLPNALATDPPLDPRQPESGRRSILGRLETFAAMAFQAGRLLAIAELASTLASRLRELWGEPVA